MVVVDLFGQVLVFDLHLAEGVEVEGVLLLKELHDGVLDAVKDAASPLYSPCDLISKLNFNVIGWYYYLIKTQREFFYW